MSDALVSS